MPPNPRTELEFLILLIIAILSIIFNIILYIGERRYKSELNKAKHQFGLLNIVDSPLAHKSTSPATDKKQKNSPKGYGKD